MKVCLLICTLLTFFTGYARANAVTTDKLEYTVQRGDWLAKIAREKFNTDDYLAVARVNKIENPDVIYPGMVLHYVPETKVLGREVVTPKTHKARVAQDATSSCAQKDSPDQVGIASWYGPGFHGKRTANGETYNMHAFTVAHRTLPLGTKVCVTSAKNGKSIVAKVNDRGPFIPPRIIDLSKRIAEVLDLIGPGTGEVQVSILSMPNPRPRNVKRSSRDTWRGAKVLHRKEDAPKDTARTTLGVFPELVDRTVVSAKTGSTDPPNEEPSDERLAIRRFLHETIGPPYNLAPLEEGMLRTQQLARGDPFDTYPTTLFNSKE